MNTTLNSKYLDSSNDCFAAKFVEKCFPMFAGWVKTIELFMIVYYLCKLFELLLNI